MGGESLVFVMDKHYAWVPAIQTSEGDAKGKADVTVFEYKTEQDIRCDSGRNSKGKKKTKVNLKDYPNGVLPLQNVDANGNLLEFPDMVNLPNLHEAGILFNLKKRHQDDKPYTRTGDIILAFNPFCKIADCYSEKKRIYYSNRIVWDNRGGEKDPRDTMDPHVYETSSLVYRGLFIDKVDQSILVSGESGAGKTYAVNICLNHIASVQRGPVKASGDESFTDPVVERIVESNPLLESFGNAKTTRNDNSSRFGKYMQLQFHDSAPNNPLPDYSKSTLHLAGSKCETYLLEKNRITGHEDTERTYHVLYQIAEAPEEEKQRIWPFLIGKNETSFKYVGKSPPNTLIDGLTDVEHYSNVKKILGIIHVEGDDLTVLQQAIACVIACGNLTFGPKADNEDASSLTSKDLSKTIAELVGLSAEDLELAFTERTMKTRTESMKVQLSPSVAKESSDAFAKEIYAKVFAYVVSKLNAATMAENNYHAKDTVEYKIIGLLDIFGFESFAINRFEQLCINYANEKLQQKFTEDIFKSVQDEYESEGIDLADISYDDNSDVLALIDGKRGIMTFLNEECVRPNGTDKTFLSKAVGNNKKDPCLLMDPRNPDSFGVHHYAGKVLYSPDYFVMRNKDSIPSDLADCMAKSTNAVVTLKLEAPGSAGKAPKRSKSNLSGSTVWNKYKVQMAALMGAVRKTRSRYIRCVKPNKEKVPRNVTQISVCEQLRCAGVIGAVTVTRSCYPNRIENETCRLRFGGMWDKAAYPSKGSDSDPKEVKLKRDCESLLECALKTKEVDGKVVFVVGHTKSYFRGGALEFLEANRAAGMDKYAVTAQALVRGHIDRLEYGKLVGNKKQAAKEAAEAKEKEAREKVEHEEREKQQRELKKQQKELEKQQAEQERAAAKERAAAEREEAEQKTKKSHARN